MTTRISPTQPITGKDSKVYLSINDGLPLVSEVMTKQANAQYHGKKYENQVYLLGSGKTLINIDPQFQPSIAIDGILSGFDVTPTEDAGKLAFTAGLAEIAEVEENVPAGEVTVSATGTATYYKYAAIILKDIDTTPVVGFVTQTGDGVELTTSLTGEFGTGAGDMPLIPVNALLLNIVVGKINSTGDAFLVFNSANIDYSLREMGGVGYQILPNVGGCLLTDGALINAHAGNLSRPVKFTGRYLDASLSLVGKAKSWTMTPSSTTVSESVFSGSFNETEMGGWTVAYSQLATDDKLVDAMLYRAGKVAMRFLYPNGRGYQSVGTLSTPIESNVGSMLSYSATGSLADSPEKVVV